MDRLLSVDQIYEQIDQAEDAEFIAYGEAQDKTPLIAIRWENKEKPSLLLFSGADGSELSTSFIALQIAPLLQADWDLWLVPLADPARGRQNQSTLTLSSPLHEILERSRKAWAPGEEVGTNIPISRDGFYQPAEESENISLPSSSENVALWRLLEHCQPDMILSLREHVNGGAAIACSQGVLEKDVKFLQNKINPILPLHEGNKIINGRQHPGISNFVTLLDLNEEKDKINPKEDTVLTGGVNFWQWGQENVTSWQIWLPRWTYATSHSKQASKQVRSVYYEGEQREDAKGNIIPIQITKLNKPNHPAHQQVIRSIELKRTQEAQVGEETDQPALIGWLAVEYWYENKELLGQVKAIVEKVREHSQTLAYDRGIQLVREYIQRQESNYKNLIQNKKFGKPATLAEEHHFSIYDKTQIGSIVGEVIALLKKEDQRDAVIEEAIQELQKINAAILPENLELVDLDHKQEWIVEWNNWLQNVIRHKGLEKALDFDRLDKARRELGSLKRQMRNAKDMKDYSLHEQKAEEVTSLQKIINKLQEKVNSHSKPEKEVKSKTSKSKNTVVKPERVALTPQIEARLREKDISDNMLDRFREKKVPVSLLEDYNIPWNQKDSKETLQQDKSKDKPQQEEKSSHNQPKKDKQEIKTPKPDVQVQEKEEKKPEQDKGKSKDKDKQEESKQEEAPEKVPMTDAIRERLKAEGLPDIIVERLEKEGVPYALVEHLEEDSGESLKQEEKIETTGSDEFENHLPQKLELPLEWKGGKLSWHKEHREQRIIFAPLAEQINTGSDNVKVSPAIILETVKKPIATLVPSKPVVTQEMPLVSAVSSLQQRTFEIDRKPIRDFLPTPRLAQLPLPKIPEEFLGRGKFTIMKRKI